MKVLMVYPNMFGMNMLPPSIGILHSCLLREGHTVALFDTTSYTNWMGGFASDKCKEANLNVRPFDDQLLRQNEKLLSPTEDFRKVVRSFSPDLIAFSLTEDCYPNALELLRALDADRPPVVVGGVFPTFAPELTLRKSEGLIDFVLIGEGEHSLPVFCKKLQRGQDLSQVEGIWFLKQDGSVHAGQLPKVVDVNDVPLPNYDFFEESRFYRPMQGKVWRMFPIETHRGCPYTCAYCNSPSQNVIYRETEQRFFRKKKISLVREELLYCINQYKADSFYFWADTFLAWSTHEFEEFCDMYSEIRLPFWVQTRPETITRDRFKRLKEVGLLRAAFGVEHGNPGFREEILSRKVSNDVIVKNINILHELGIPFSVNNIMGFPRETRELAFDTIELNRHIYSDGMNAYSFTPFHGVPLRPLAEELGYVQKGDIARSLTKPTMLRMPHWSKEEIEGLRRCFVLYVKLPKSRWHEVEPAEKLTPEGDRIWEELRLEVLNHYMNWGDRDHHDEPGKVRFEGNEAESTDATESSVIDMVTSRTGGRDLSSGSRP
ncbi:MAG: B12-binding domain-containing radical SAM protein [Nitrospirae bacterium]|nr:B12-binding domain-containing radical SAM protein [Nitrospirota bacterium]